MGHPWYKAFRAVIMSLAEATFSTRRMSIRVAAFYDSMAETHRTGKMLRLIIKFHLVG